MKRFVRLATLTATCSLVVVSAGSALAGATPAHTVPASVHVVSTVSQFTGTYTGTTGAWRSEFAPSLSVSPAELGLGGSATFTTTITETTNAATWTCSTASTLCHPELIVAGFGHGVGNARLEGDGSLLYGQNNSRSAGYCSNDQFEHGATFVFGAGSKCEVSRTFTQTYTVTITGENTFTDTVSTSTGAFSTGSATVAYTGTLGSTPTTTYTPAIYLLPGRTATDKTASWAFTVSGTSYTVTG